MSTTPSASEHNTSSILPPGHPPVSSHTHAKGICPVTGESHEYCPPQDDDLRSVCPALNTMANHGYIPRDGRNLTFNNIFRGLKACYGLSTPLAIVLTTGGFVLIKRSPIHIPFLSSLPFFRARNPDGSISPAGVIDLHLIGLHNGVEHDASLVHENTPEGKKYAPTEIQEHWVEKLVGDISPPVEGYVPTQTKTLAEDTVDHKRLSSAASSSSGTASGSGSGSSTIHSTRSASLKKFTSDAYLNTLVDEADVGRMRARRQTEILPRKLNGVHAEIARGEMAIILGVWQKEVNGKKGIPLPWLLQWLAEERLPEVETEAEADADTETVEVEVPSSHGPIEVNVEDVSGKKASIKTRRWKPTHLQPLLDVHKRSVAIRAVADKIQGVKA